MAASRILEEAFSRGFSFFFFFLFFFVYCWCLWIWPVECLFLNVFPDSHVPLIEQKLAPLNHVYRLLKEKWCQRCLQLEGLNYLQLSSDDLTSTCSTSFSFFNGGRHEAHFGNAGMPDPKMSGKDPFNRRKWTNILLAANVLWVLAYSFHQHFKFMTSKCAYCCKSVSSNSVYSHFSFFILLLLDYTVFANLHTTWWDGLLIIIC